MSLNEIVLVGVIVFLVGVNIYEKLRYDKRERDFLNRLMSRDFTQYVQGTTALDRIPAPTTVEEVASHFADELAKAEGELEGGTVRVGA